MLLFQFFTVFHMSHLLLNVLSILWQMPRMLMCYNDWFHICKDLMEGEINYNYNNNYRTITLITHITSTTIWKPHFKKLKIMTVPYIYNSTFHSFGTRNVIFIYLFHVITPNYLNRVSHTTVCLFITNFLVKLKALHVLV